MELLVDGVPYEVTGQVFAFNDQQRVRITVNNGNQHVFVWDPDTVSLRALDEGAIELPGSLEKEISDRLVKTVISG